MLLESLLLLSGISRAFSKTAAYLACTTTASVVALIAGWYFRHAQRPDTQVTSMVRSQPTKAWIGVSHRYLKSVRLRGETLRYQVACLPGGWQNSSEDLHELLLVDQGKKVQDVNYPWVFKRSTSDPDSLTTDLDDTVSVLTSYQSSNSPVAETSPDVQHTHGGIPRESNIIGHVPQFQNPESSKHFLDENMMEVQVLNPCSRCQITTQAIQSGVSKFWAQLTWRSLFS